MTRYSDAALLKGNYASLLKEPPKETEWNMASCDNGAELSAQAIAKQIFGFQQDIDEKTEKLEVVTFSALGPIKVLAITPLEGELMRIDGMHPENGTPVSIVQHFEQLSLTFTRALLKSENPDERDDDDGLRIGYVIFDELTDRKKKREAVKRKKPAAKKAPAKKKAAKK